MVVYKLQTFIVSFYCNCTLNDLYILNFFYGVSVTVAYSLVLTHIFLLCNKFVVQSAHMKLVQNFAKFKDFSPIFAFYSGTLV